MNANLSVLLLSFTCSLNSPIFNSPRLSFSNNYIFNGVNIHHIFNSFFYSKYQHQLNLKNSKFLNILNSAIFQSSDNIKEQNLIFTNRYLVNYNQSYIINNIEVADCCFVQCTATGQDLDGGAIYTEWDYTNIELASTIFSKCSSTRYGGAIYTRNTLNIQSSIFVSCQSEIGSVISLNNSKTNFQNSHIVIDQVLFMKNVAKSSPFDLNTNSNICRNANITSNANEEHNDPNSDVQFGCGYSSITDQSQTNSFIFNNLVGNDGDFLIDIQYSSSNDISHVNIINNINLNFFFRFNDKNVGPDVIQLDKFAFFGNKANSKSVRIKVANSISAGSFSLKDCLFEYTENEVKSMLNGHSQIGGLFGRSLTTFIQNFLLDKPTKCEVDLNPPPSHVFTASLAFTPSSFFTPNKTRVPDPRNIFNRAEITGRVRDLFTKEELKKAVVPLSISGFIIVAAIVMTIVYARVRILQMRAGEDAPDFDTYLNGENADDYSDYSYSYYSYTYISVSDGHLNNVECDINSDANYSEFTYSGF